MLNYKKTNNISLCILIYFSTTVFTTDYYSIFYR